MDKKLVWQKDNFPLKNSGELPHKFVISHIFFMLHKIGQNQPRSDMLRRYVYE